MVKTLTWIFGIVFLLVGILGYIPNPIVGASGLFETNGTHNLVHLLSGIVGIIAALSGEKASKMYLQVFGVVYALVAVLGFVLASPLLGLVVINGADNWLHVVLALVLLWGGFGSMKKMGSAPAM